MYEQNSSWVLSLLSKKLNVHPQAEGPRSGKCWLNSLVRLVLDGVDKINRRIFRLKHNGMRFAVPFFLGKISDTPEADGFFPRPTPEYKTKGIKTMSCPVSSETGQRWRLLRIGVSFSLGQNFEIIP